MEVTKIHLNPNWPELTGISDYSKWPTDYTYVLKKVLINFVHQKVRLLIAIYSSKDATQKRYTVLETKREQFGKRQGNHRKLESIIFRWQHVTSFPAGIFETFPTIYV